MRVVLIDEDSSGRSFYVQPTQGGLRHYFWIREMSVSAGVDALTRLQVGPPHHHLAEVVVNTHTSFPPVDSRISHKLFPTEFLTRANVEGSSASPSAHAKSTLGAATVSCSVFFEWRAEVLAPPNTHENWEPPPLQAACVAPPSLAARAGVSDSTLSMLAAMAAALPAHAGLPPGGKPPTQP